jgi:hypothetical protein
VARDVQGYGVYLASFFSSVVCFFIQLQPTITTSKTSVFIEFSLNSTLSIDVIFLSIDVAPLVATGVDFQPNSRDSGYGRRDKAFSASGERFPFFFFVFVFGV